VYQISQDNDNIDPQQVKICRLVLKVLTQATFMYTEYVSTNLL